MTGQREVLVYDTEDRPGELGERARAMVDSGVNVDLVYLTTSGEIVFGVDDLDRPRGAS